jgi:hypothetical protein
MVHDPRASVWRTFHDFRYALEQARAVGGRAAVPILLGEAKDERRLTAGIG